MGRLQASEMVARLKQEQALQWHLQYNHYPPVSLTFLPAAVAAIDKVNAGDYNSIIVMPNGKSLTAAEIVEGLHLDVFLNEEQLGED